MNNKQFHAKFDPSLCDWSIDKDKYQDPAKHIQSNWHDTSLCRGTWAWRCLSIKRKKGSLWRQYKSVTCCLMFLCKTPNSICYKSHNCCIMVVYFRPMLRLFHKVHPQWTTDFSVEGPWESWTDWMLSALEQPGNRSRKKLGKPNSVLNIVIICMFTIVKHIDLECELDTLKLNTMSHVKFWIYVGTHFANMGQLPTKKHFKLHIIIWYHNRTSVYF